MKKTRRGRRKRAKNVSKSIRFLGVNAAGLKPKLFTFKKVLLDLQPSVFFVQESKFKEDGKLKIENYVIFDLVRDSREGGGLVLGCVKELKPVLVRKGNEDVEAMSVDIFVKSMKIRCCVAYGCQENALIEKKKTFWDFIEEEVESAWTSGSGFVLQFDGNLWAGDQLVPGDPRKQNKNGKLFQGFLARQPNLSVVNALPLCEGLITRCRSKEGNIEKSVLDFFVVCSRVLPHITKMVIDEKRKHILTNYRNVRKGVKAIDSDHFTEYMDVNLQLITEKPVRREIFNFKDKESLEAFKDITSRTEEFSDCYNDDQPLLKQVEQWREVLKSHCQRAFKKIRINKKRYMKPLKPEISRLIDQRNNLKKNFETPENKKKLEELDEVISEKEAEENRDYIVKNFKKYSDNPEKVNLQEVWKLLKNISPKYENMVPIAKHNHKGKLISDPDEIKKLLAK